ncbi:hypothetical protein V5799_026787, partial [Amblyomma americanum]
MALPPYAVFLVPKWRLFLIASVLPLLHRDFNPTRLSYDTRKLYEEYDYVI